MVDKEAAAAVGRVMAEAVRAVAVMAEAMVMASAEAVRAAAAGVRAAVRAAAARVVARAEERAARAVVTVVVTVAVVTVAVVMAAATAVVRAVSGCGCHQRAIRGSSHQGIRSSVSGLRTHTGTRSWGTHRVRNGGREGGRGNLHSRRSNG